MESDENRELRAVLPRLKQEHRDLDSAINALEESGRADALQLKRLKKKKLSPIALTYLDFLRENKEDIIQQKFDWYLKFKSPV